MLELAIGVCLGVLLTLASQRLLKRKPAAQVLEFPASRQRESTGFVDSILDEETEDEVLERLRRNLRVKVFHDDAQFERLLESERRRTPQASARLLLEAAIERWERDNR